MADKRKEYYGPFIWLAALSLIAPIAVAYRAFEGLPRPYSFPEIEPDASGVDQNVWDHLLKSYVENGLVDYDGLRRDHLFKVYLKQLAHAEPEKLTTDADRLALLSNAYNALVINGVLIHKIKRSVLDFEVDGAGFFDAKEHILAGETMSLNHLEHELIRPIYQDPRVHMALVCAARSCPALRPEAFQGNSLEQQFDDQANLFANNRAYLRFDAEANSLVLSKILQWYGDDFGGAAGYVEFLSSRVRDPKLKQALQGVSAGSVRVVFDDYDWTLNGQAAGEKATGLKSADFGSGSVPNQ